MNGDPQSPSYLGKGEINVSFDPRGEFVNYCRPCLAHDFVLGIRASRTTDCADNIALVDQWNAASRRNDSVEREQIVEMHKVDTVLEEMDGGAWSPAVRLNRVTSFGLQSQKLPDRAKWRFF